MTQITIEYKIDNKNKNFVKEKTIGSIHSTYLNDFKQIFEELENMIDYDNITYLSISINPSNTTDTIETTDKTNTKTYPNIENKQSLFPETFELPLTRFPKNLECLDISDCYFTNIPKLPETLKQFYASFNRFTPKRMADLFESSNLTSIETIELCHNFNSENSEKDTDTFQFILSVGNSNLKSLKFSHNYIIYTNYTNYNSVFHNSFEKIPTSIQELDLSNCTFNTPIHKLCFNEYKNLKSLNINNVKVRKLIIANNNDVDSDNDDNDCKLYKYNLEYLFANHCGLYRLNGLPYTIRHIELSYNNLYEFSLNNKYRNFIKHLNISYNKLDKLEINKETMNYIRYLDCSNNNLTKLDTYELHSVEHLNCSNNKIGLQKTLKEQTIYIYYSMEYCNCSNNYFRIIHTGRPLLLEHFYARNNDIRNLPISMLNDTIQTIDLYKNNIEITETSELNTSHMKKLTYLNLGLNQIETITSLAPNLQYLYLESNYLKELPELPNENLVELNLYNNELTCELFNIDIDKFPKLKLLNIARNNFKTLPIDETKIQELNKTNNNRIKYIAYYQNYD